MLGRIFGRRPEKKSPGLAIPRHPGPDADGVSRIIPKEIFDGKMGDLLRQCGMSPDDPSNMMATPELMQARADAVKATQDKLVAAANAQLPSGTTVIPWALIPWSVWGREPARFLMVTCEFFPASHWNTMLLPADEHSALVLGLPQHPRAAAEGVEDAAVRLLGELEEEFMVAHNKVGEGLARGDTSVLDGVMDTRNAFTGQVVGLAHYLGSAVFGEPVWKRHDEVFGQFLWRT